MLRVISEEFVAASSSDRDNLLSERKAQLKTLLSARNITLPLLGFLITKIVQLIMIFHVGQISKLLREMYDTIEKINSPVSSRISYHHLKLFLFQRSYLVLTYSFKLDCHL